MSCRHGNEIVKSDVGDVFKVSNVFSKPHMHIVPQVVPMSTASQYETKLSASWKSRILRF
jgi:hypothetical protein